MMISATSRYSDDAFVQRSASTARGFCACSSGRFYPFWYEPAVYRHWHLNKSPSLFKQFSILVRPTAPPPVAMIILGSAVSSCSACFTISKASSPSFQNPWDISTRLINDIPIQSTKLRPKCLASSFPIVVLPAPIGPTKKSQVVVLIRHYLLFRPSPLQ